MDAEKAGEVTKAILSFAIGLVEGEVDVLGDFTLG
jgi:hypothetical protein